MIRTVYILLLCFIAGNATAQGWRDSLSVARKYYQEKNYTAALEKYQQTQRIAPKNISFSNEIAQAAYRAGKFNQALNLYEKTAKKNQSANAYHNLGNAYLQAKEYQKAVEAYKNALRLNPQDDETRYNLAYALQKQEQKPQPKQEPNPQNNQDESPKNQPNNPKPEPKEEDDNKPSSDKKPSKLADKKTDRILNDLMRQEMDTKKKMERQKQGSTHTSGKDW